MKSFKSFDKIEEMGFGIRIEWNESIQIYLKAKHLTTKFHGENNILYCSYDNNFYDYEEICCDLFYEWYNKNKSIVEAFLNESHYPTTNEYYDSIVGIGDVSLKVKREINLEKLL